LRCQPQSDWKPGNRTDAAIAAAISHDAGFSWTFQQKALELRTLCPPGDNGDNGDDDGQGHAYVIDIAGHRYLYTLIRANTHIDVDDLAIHELTPRPGRPLEGAPDLTDAPTDQDPQDPEPAFHTHGLVNPDGITQAATASTPIPTPSITSAMPSRRI
jgi:hypothetical protein